MPGRPIFDIGSPIFQESTINVGGEKTFVIEAKNVSARNKYIQSATLNGVVWNKPWMNNSDLMKGGKLTLVMGQRPNKSWGNAPGDAAPSMSAATINKINRFQTTNSSAGGQGTRRNLYIANVNPC